MEDFAPEMIEIAQSFIAMDAPRHTDSSRRVRGLGFLSHPTVARELL
jgi:hypothetical protein